MILKKGMHLQNDSYLSSNLSETTELGTKLKPSHSSFILNVIIVNVSIFILLSINIRKTIIENLKKKHGGVHKHITHMPVIIDYQMGYQVKA